MRLKDKVSIITGAGQGIGEAYARRFARGGRQGRRRRHQRGEGRGGGARDRRAARCSSAVDVSSEEDTQRVAKAVHDRFGRIDVLLNNAAIFYGIDNFDTRFAYLKKIFDVNYFGTWLMCRAVFPYMAAERRRLGDQPVVDRRLDAPRVPDVDDELPSFHYSVTKAAINAMTHFMAGTVGIYNIRVNAIAPGPTMTEATKQGVPASSTSSSSSTCRWRSNAARARRPHRHRGVARVRRLEDGDRSVIPVDGGMIMLG